MTEQGPAATAASQVVNVDPVAAASTVYAAVLADPTDVTPTTTERSLDERNIDVSAPCAVQPDGYGPKTTPDTVADFLANPVYSVSWPCLCASLLCTHNKTENCLERSGSCGLQSRIPKPERLMQRQHIHGPYNTPIIRHHQMPGVM